MWIMLPIVVVLVIVVLVVAVVRTSVQTCRTKSI